MLLVEDRLRLVDWSTQLLGMRSAGRALAETQRLVLIKLSHTTARKRLGIRLIDWSSSNFLKQQQTGVAFGGDGSTCCDLGMGLALKIALAETRRLVQ